MPIIQAKQFNTRKDLEAEVSKGSATEIKGTMAELAHLGLSDRTSVFGIKCTATDPPVKSDKQTAKPDRGKKFPSGLNNNLK